MPSLTFVLAVDVRSLGVIRRASPGLTALENDLNHHALIRQRMVNRFHRPWRFQSKRLFAQRGVFLDFPGKFKEPQFSRIEEKITVEST